MNFKKILITGAGGYVGTPLVTKLLSNGFKIIALDTFWYGCHLQAHKNLTIIKGDLRSIELENMLADVDAVVHLACISNDPSYELNTAFSESINIGASIRLIEQCKKSKIKRFVFASSSSVYGVRKESQVTEDLLPEPLTVYSKSKVVVEDYLRLKTKDDFDVVILRPATVYGISPRLRLDVVCNLLSAQAFFNNVITVHGGEQLRPQIHIDKITSIYQACLTEDRHFSGEIFNASEENYSVKNIAEQVKNSLSRKVEISFLPMFDPRSYKINSLKLSKFFNVSLVSNLENGILELMDFFTHHPNMDWTDEQYHNVKKLKTICND